MADIGSLNVRLVANSSQFTKTLTSAARSVDTFGARIGSMAKTAGGFALRACAAAFATITAAVTAAGAAFVVMQKNAMSAIDDLAKNADKIGISTQALAGLQYAGDLAGVEIEGLNKSIQKMERGIADAAGGNKQLASTFKALGLNVKVLKELRGDEQFLLIADAINALGNPINRIQAAYDIFGKQGAALLPMIMGGTDAMREQIAEANKLGLALGRVDAAKVEEANDALSKSASAVRGFFTQLSPMISPVITDIANRFTELFIGADGIQARARQAFEFMTRAITKAALSVDVIKIAFDGVQLKILDIMIIWSKFTKSIVESPIGGILPGGKKETLKSLDDEIAAYQGLQGKLIGQTISKFFGGKMKEAEIKNYFDSIEESARKNAEATAANAKKATGAYDDLYESLNSVDKKMKEMAGTDRTAQLTDFSGRLKQLQDNAANSALMASFNNAAANASPSRSIGPQMVRDPQLQQTNTLLQRLIEKPTGAVLN